MEKKQFEFEDGKKYNYECYESCPVDAGIELSTVINTELQWLNTFLNNTVDSYGIKYPDITRPKLYVCLREDGNLEANAFTDGKDIYITASMMIGLQSFIEKRISMGGVNWLELVPAQVKEGMPLHIYNYLLKFVVGHELIHIWHRHSKWKNAVLRVSSVRNNPVADILSEMVNGECDDDSCLTENFEIRNGQILCSGKADKNYFQQVLEIDADSCAMCLVLADLQREMDALARPLIQDIEANRDKINSIIHLHSYYLGIISGAAALMFGYFDSQHVGKPFDRLSLLLKFDHPIPAIRFAKTDATMTQWIHKYYEDNDFADALLSYTDIFTTQIFMDDGHTMDIRNCFWAPSQTEMAQVFMTYLEKGWNLIHDSLQSFALLDIPKKFSPEELMILKRFIRFNDKGNPLLFY